MVVVYLTQRPLSVYDSGGDAPNTTPPVCVTQWWCTEHIAPCLCNTMVVHLTQYRLSVYTQCWRCTYHNAPCLCKTMVLHLTQRPLYV